MRIFCPIQSDFAQHCPAGAVPPVLTLEARGIPWLIARRYSAASAVGWGIG